MSDDENITKCRNCGKEYNIETSSSEENYEDFCCSECESENLQEAADAREIMLTENQLLKDHERGR